MDDADENSGDDEVMHAEHPATEPAPGAPWLPPATPTATSEATTAAPYVSVVLPEAPHPRHTARWVVLGLVVVAALAAGAIFLFRGDDAPTYSLDAAIARDTSGIPAVDMDLTTKQGGDTVRGTAVYDVESRLMKMTMSGDAFGTDQDVTLILDAGNATMYMESKPFADLGAEVDTEWISIDLADMTNGLMGECMFGPAGTSPYSVLAPMAKAESTTRLEMDDIDGEQVRHYEVVLDPRSGADTSCLQQLTEQTGQDLPDEMIYDVWITKGNELRRYGVEFEVGGDKVAYDYVIHPLDEPADITVPADDDVTDINDLL